MSTKPSDLVRWGVDGGDADTTNLTVPSSGEKDTGWTLGQDPSSGVFNWLGNRSYRWFKYLSDGAFQGASTFDSSLGISGSATVGGGALTIAPSSFVSTDNIATPVSTIFTTVPHGLNTGDGPIRLSGTIPTGTALATDYWVIVTDVDKFRIADTLAHAFNGIYLTFTSLVLSGGIYASGVGATKKTNVTISGNLVVGGRIERGARWETISPISGQNVGTGTFPRIGGAATDLTGTWSATAANDTLGISIPTTPGQRLHQVAVTVERDTVATLQCTVYLWGPLTPTSRATGVSTTGSGSQTVTLTIGDDTLDDVTSNYNLSIRCVGNPGVAPRPRVLSIAYQISEPSQP